MTTDTSAVMSVEEAAELLRIGRGTMYELIRRGECPVRVIRLGRLIRLPAAEVRALLEGSVAA